MDFDRNYLWWDFTGNTSATIVYGEITVLATTPGTYYCGANWHPCEQASGYCGIQDKAPTERWTIFSIWDTTDNLLSKVTEAGPSTVYKRIHNEESCAKTHVDLNWQLGETFHFIVKKSQSITTDTTDARYYIFNSGSQTWEHLATIQNPNGGVRTVQTVVGRGSLASFLEDFTGENKAAPRLALYRLWVGTDAGSMNTLTKAICNEDGAWGIMHDAYFLVQGSRTNYEPLFKTLEGQYGRPKFGGGGQTLPSLTPRPIPTPIRAALNNLPSAPAVH